MAIKPSNYGLVCLALSSFLLVYQAAEVMGFGNLFPSLVFLAGLSACMLIAQFLSFNSDNSRFRLQLAGTLVLLLLTIAQLAILTSKGYLLTDNIKYTESVVFFGFMFIAAMLPLVFGTEIMRRFKDRRLKALGLILICFAIFAVVFFLLVGFVKVSITDAMWLGYQGDKALLMGHNPYLLNYSGLYNSAVNGSVNSFTITTNGKIVGFLGYPSLYLVLSMPFVVSTALTLAQFPRVQLFEEIAYTLILFGVIAYFGGRINRKSFIALALVIPLVFFTLISLVDMLMLAALLIAYLRPDKWYFGVALGIAVSIQQLAWIPAIMLLLYTLANSRPGKARLDLAVLAATVLITNGWFLLTSPLAYLHNIFGLLGNVLPTSLSPIGTLLIQYYNMPLPYFQLLFYLALASSIVAFLYSGRRRNFAILALVPFLFLSFGRIEYYSVFIIIGIAAAALDGGQPEKAKPRLPTSLACASLMAFAVAMVAIVVYGHANYLHSFPVLVSNPSLVLASGNTIYSAALQTGSLNGSERILLYSFYKNLSGDVPIFINNDTVTLKWQGGSSSYFYNGLNGEADDSVNIQAGMNSPTGLLIEAQNDSAGYSECAIYNGIYFYFCPIAGRNPNS